MVATEYISFCWRRGRTRLRMSRPSEKFLIEPSRKFLLTAVRLKDGTNRDEPRGTRPAGVVKASQGQSDQPAKSGPAHGGKRSLGAQAAATDESRRRRGGGAWIAGAGVGSENREAHR